VNAALTVPDASPITLTVNGTAHTTAACTLAQWLDDQGLAGDALATAVNGAFVPRAQRAQRPLAEGDAIVTFQPIEGG